MSVAVLGLGSIGLRHARNLLALDRSVVGFDPAPDRRSALIKSGGTAVATRDAAIEAAAAVVVASPNAHHFDDMAAAVDAGRHVFVEKPLAHKVDGVNEVLERALAADRVVFAGLNQRFNPAIREARALIAAGRLGTVLWGRFLAALYLPDWRPWQDHRKGYAADPTTGGVIFDAVHEFDLAHYLLGAARTLAATARCSGVLEIPSDDIADIVLGHPGGVVSSLHLDYVTRPPRRIIDLAGTAGLLNVDVLARRLVLHDGEGKTALERAYDTTYDDDYRDEMAAFLDCIEGGGEPACDGREALAVLGQVIAARSLAGLPGAAEEGRA